MFFVLGTADVPGANSETQLVEAEVLNWFSCANTNLSTIICSLALTFSILFQFNAQTLQVKFRLEPALFAPRSTDLQVSL